MRYLNAIVVFLVVANICYAETFLFKNMTSHVVHVWVQPNGSTNFLRPPTRVFPQEVCRVYVGESFPAYLVARDQDGNDDYLGWYKRTKNSPEASEFIYQYKPVFETRVGELAEYDHSRRTYRTRKYTYRVCQMIPAHILHGMELLTRASPSAPKGSSK